VCDQKGAWVDVHGELPGESGCSPCSLDTLRDHSQQIDDFAAPRDETRSVI
jgi:hypothetical protein